MKKLNLLAVLLIGLSVTGLQSCKKKGCMDEFAINYNADAKKDDGSCYYDENYERNQEIQGTWSAYSYLSDGEESMPWYLKKYTLKYTMKSGSEGTLTESANLEDFGSYSVNLSYVLKSGGKEITCNGVLYSLDVVGSGSGQVLLLKGVNQGSYVVIRLKKQ